MTPYNEYETPERWTRSTLNTAARLVKDKIDPAAVPDDLPYVGLEHVQAHTMKLLGHGQASDVKSAKTRFNAGDVLYGKLRPYLNKVAHPNFDGICSTDFLVFGDSPELDRGYLAHYLNQLWIADRAHHASTGVELPRVDWQSLGQLPIVYPKSKDTQRAIVGRINRAATFRTSAASHVAAARRAIERFRQAVLAAACSGRLTADWREQHGGSTSARDLVDQVSYQRGRIGNRFNSPAAAVLPEEELPDSWCWTTVGTLVDVATGATPLRKRKDYYGGAIPWVTSGAVNAGLITEATEYITELAIHETNAKVFPIGTLLVAMYGEGQTRGRVGELGISAATNQAVAALLFDEHTAHLRPYVRLFFLENYERIRSQSFGGVQPNLSLGAIRNTPLPLPPQAEQLEIIIQVSQLLGSASTLEGRINMAARRIDRSAQAVLSKAFRGDLLADGEAASEMEKT